MDRGTSHAGSLTGRKPDWSRRIAVSVFVLAAMGLLLYTKPSPVHACSCALPPMDRAFRESDEVFGGVVTDFERPWPKLPPGTPAPDATDAVIFSNQLMTVTLQVYAVWKGAVESEMKVHTELSGASCGYHFVKGEAYVVFAFQRKGEQLRTGLCSRTFKYADPPTDADFIGQPTMVDDGAALERWTPEPVPSWRTAVEPTVSDTYQDAGEPDAYPPPLPYPPPLDSETAAWAATPPPPGFEVQATPTPEVPNPAALDVTSSVQPKRRWLLTIALAVAISSALAWWIIRSSR